MKRTGQERFNTDVLIFGGIALIFAILSIPMLASSPQNPDGAELVMTALHGGVLHPPGFPLQSWLDRGVIWAILALSGRNTLEFNSSETARILSSFSLVGFSGALFFLGLVLRELGASLGGACLGLACFAFYPPAWRLAVEPEKYALLFFLISVFSYGALKWGVRGIVFAERFLHHHNNILLADSISEWGCIPTA